MWLRPHKGERIPIRDGGLGEGLQIEIIMLKVKATEQKIRIGKYADTFRYVMQPEMYAQLAQDKVIKEAALRSGVSRGIMQACWDAAAASSSPPTRS